MLQILLPSTPIVGVFCTSKNRVVKIVHSNFEMVLQTTKHTMIYPSSGTSLKVIALHPVVWYWRWTCFTKGFVESLWSSHGEGGNGPRVPTWSVGGFYRPSMGWITIDYLLLHLRVNYMASGTQTEKVSSLWMDKASMAFFWAPECSS
jgi:hypothetical protein